MLSQREIREKALLFLFAYATNKELLPEDDSFWELSLEPLQAKISKQTVKTLAHQLQTFPKWTEELNTIVPILAPMLKTYELKSEARTLLSLDKAFSQLSSTLSVINASSKPQELEKFFEKCRTTEASLNSFITSFNNSPFSDPSKPKLEKALKQLKELLSRSQIISSPLHYEEEKAVETLYKLAKQKDDMKKKASSFAKNVVEKLDQLDPLIAENLHNFSEEQIGRIERSILRMATYEITQLELPKAIVINEAIELSRKFCSEDATSLINGVLDKINS